MLVAVPAMPEKPSTPAIRPMIRNTAAQYSNYDSFTYNLWHFLGELGAEVAVHRNDRVSVSDVM